MAVSAGSAGAYGVPTQAAPARRKRWSGVAGYFASDGCRAVQSALGLVWLLDGALQFQSFMYTSGFLQSLSDGAAGQPLWLESTIKWSVHVMGQDLAVWNTFFALLQVAIGLGLLYRPTVRPALALSVVWGLALWWVGEGFGMLFMMMATPLGGAPGAALLYALVSLSVWPVGRPGGLLGARGVRIAWAGLWLLMAWLWVAPQSSSQGSVALAIRNAPSGMGWLSSVKRSVASATDGHGLVIALLLGALSAAVGIAVACDWHPRRFLAAGVALNVVYWVLGQGFGGIFTGSGTDPNSAPLFILFALVLYALPSTGRRWAASSASSVVFRRL